MHSTTPLYTKHCLAFDFKWIYENVVSYADIALFQAKESVIHQI